MEYFQNNWLNCKEKWVRYARLDLPLALQETNNPVEVVNKQIKSFSQKGAKHTLGSCIENILDYILYTEFKRKSEYINSTSSTVRPQYDDPVCKDIFELLPGRIAYWVAGQYISSKKAIFNQIGQNSASDSVEIQDENSKIRFVVDLLKTFF